MDDIKELLNSIEYDPDLYFYLRLRTSHIWGVEPFYAVGDLILLSILSSENRCKPGDLCIILTDTLQLIRIFGLGDNPEYYVFTAANSKIPPLVLHKSKCRVYKIIQHLKDN